MTTYITPNDPAFLGKSDTEKIRAAVALAEKTGIGEVVIPRYNEEKKSKIWTIEDTIALPSDMTVILDGCCLRMADGVIATMFMNSAARTPAGNTRRGKQERIRIIGRCGAVLDGGKPNALNEQTSRTGDLPHVSRNLLIYFHNVKDFEVSGFTVENQRWWAMAFMYSRAGRIANLRFRLTRHALDTRGVWRNQDGIDLRIGCRNIIIEDIEGETGDDFIALTALMGENFEQPEFIEGLNPDIHDIIIRDIRGMTNMCALVRLLCHYGLKIYNVSMTNLFETARPGLESRSQMTLRIGDDASAYYGTPDKHVKPGDMFNITIDNVFSHSHCALNLCGGVRSMTVRNLHVMEDGGYACFFGYAGADNVFLFHKSRLKEYNAIRFAPFRSDYPAVLEDITVENVFCDSDGTLAPAAVGASNVILKNVAVRGLRTKDPLPAYLAFADVEGHPRLEGDAMKLYGKYKGKNAARVKREHLFGETDFACSLCRGPITVKDTVCPRCGATLSGEKNDPVWIDEKADYDEMTWD